MAWPVSVREMADDRATTGLHSTSSVTDLTNKQE